MPEYLHNRERSWYYMYNSDYESDGWDAVMPSYLPNGDKIWELRDHHDEVHPILAHPSRPVIYNPTSVNKPSNTVALASASPEMQKSIIGEYLHPLIYQTQPGLAKKVYGYVVGVEHARVVAFARESRGIEYQDSRGSLAFGGTQCC